MWLLLWGLACGSGGGVRGDGDTLYGDTAASCTDGLHVFFGDGSGGWDQGTWVFTYTGPETTVECTDVVPWFPYSDEAGCVALVGTLPPDHYGCAIGQQEKPETHGLCGEHFPGWYPDAVAVEVSLDGESRYSDTHELTYGGNCERATLDLDFTIRSR